MAARAKKAIMVPADRAVAVPAGRLTRDEHDSLLGFSQLSAIIPPSQSELSWRRLNLDAHTLDRISPMQLTDLMIDVSPEISRALFDFLRECNAGWEAKAIQIGTEKTVDVEAQAALNEDLARIKDLYGTLDVPINQMFLSAWLRGAAFAEGVIAQDRRSISDLAIVDPAHARFKKIKDANRGIYHQLGQLQSGKWVALDRPTIRYIPIDNLPQNPYGRAMISPALFTGLFLIGMLHDLRRVIAQQGYPRLDIEIDLEMLAKRMPTHIIPGSKDEQNWVEAVVAQVARYYSSLEPDMAFTHSSLVKINRPVGTVGAEQLGGLDAIFGAVERMAVRGVKSTPFMLALSESTTEAQANRQYEIHAIGVRSQQHIVEEILEQLFTIGLQARGIVAKVQWRFTENRVSEEIRDAQVLQLKLKNAREAYNAGYWSQDEAALYAVGKEKADQEEPREAAIAEPDNQSKENPDPGASRSLPPLRIPGLAS